MKVLYLLVALTVMTEVIQVQAFLGLAIAAIAIAAAGGFVGHHLASRASAHGRSGQAGSSGSYRQRRDLTALAAGDEQKAHVLGLQMDAYFTAVQIADDDDCGLRLVCELHTMDPALLGDEENMILALFGADMPSSGRPDSPKRPYDAAAQLGRRAGKAEACAETFKACQYDSQTLIEAIHTSIEQ